MHLNVERDNEIQNKIPTCHLGYLLLRTLVMRKFLISILKIRSILIFAILLIIFYKNYFLFKFSEIIISAKN